MGKIADSTVAALLHDESGQTIEVIVEAKIPERKFVVRQGSSAVGQTRLEMRPNQESIGDHSSLDEVGAILKKLSKRPPRILKHAGAAVAEVDRMGLLELLNEDIVARISANRQRSRLQQ